MNMTIANQREDTGNSTNEAWVKAIEKLDNIKLEEWNRLFDKHWKELTNVK